MDEDNCITLYVLKGTKKKSLKNLPKEMKIRDVVKKALELFGLPTTDISDQTYNILLGSKAFNSNENLDKTLDEKEIDDDETISIYNLTEIILGKFIN